MSDQKHPVIIAEHLTKDFKFWAERPSNLKSFLNEVLKGKAFKAKKSTINVLKDVSFKIHQGDFVGIMGKNGAGKSTLMRLITGIYEPTSGQLSVQGQVAPLISLGAGFNPELSGLENIFLNASILGFGQKRTLETLSSIIEFSELGEHINAPIKNYSSGMVVRLGFSIAAHLDAPILLLDEVLGVGDQGFAEKSMKKILELHAEGRTVVLVSHSPVAVARHCNRCIVINAGKKVFDGSATEGAEVYRNLFPSKTP